MRVSRVRSATPGVKKALVPLLIKLLRPASQIPRSTAVSDPDHAETRSLDSRPDERDVVPSVETAAKTGYSSILERERWGDRGGNRY
jgi:hypothetical protein